jgi:molybdopterin/thiamine biosynthesis adenylyltransferase
MSYQGIGQSRISLAARRLQEFNPFVEIVPVEENIDDENAENLISQVDVVACCAPVFEERLSMNRQAVRQKTPLVDCAMFELEGQITTVLPGKTPCLACLYPSIPANWKRQFPVLGAVSGTVGCLGAIEIIKIISGMGPTLAGQMLLCDLWNMNFRKVSISRNPKCPECGPLFA